MFRRRTPPILGRDRRPYPGSVARLERVPIGGVEQWVLLRGVDETQPVVLLVPDGPGETLLPLARAFQGELERAFVVANWDPRGAGLSFDPRAPTDALTLDRLVEDTVEMVRWLGDTLHRDRIVLAGHGFGSVVGILAAARAPERLEAYIGVGQWVEPRESDRRALAWARTEAERNGPPRRLAEANALAEAAEDDPSRAIRLRLLVKELGGEIHQPEGRSRAHPRWADLAEYTVFDLGRRRRGIRAARKALGPTVRSLDLVRRVTRLEVPAFFLAGRYDHLVDPELAREYLRVLEAPRKGWAWIEETAHLAPFEDPEAYAAALAHFAHDARGPTGPHWSVAG